MASKGKGLEMSNTMTAVSNLVRGLVSLAILGLLIAGGWVAYQAYDQRLQLDRELKEKTTQLAAKTAEVERLTKENQKLNLALRLLKIDHRLAEAPECSHTVFNRGESRPVEDLDWSWWRCDFAALAII